MRASTTWEGLVSTLSARAMKHASAPQISRPGRRVQDPVTEYFVTSIKRYKHCSPGRSEGVFDKLLKYIILQHQYNTVMQKKAR